MEQKGYLLRQAGPELLGRTAAWQDEGVRMHIHGNPVNLPVYGFESAQAAQKSAAEAQATQVRKQLLSSARDFEGISDFAYHPVGSDQGQGRQQQPRQPQERLLVKGVRVEEETVAERGISVWA